MAWANPPVPSKQAERLPLTERTPAGTIQYLDDPEGPIGMIFRCPSGCGKLGIIYFGNVDNEALNDEPKYTWNHDREKPSIREKIDRDEWTGHLKEGVWIREIR